MDEIEQIQKNGSGSNVKNENPNNSNQMIQNITEIDDYDDDYDVEIIGDSESDSKDDQDNQYNHMQGIKVERPQQNLINFDQIYSEDDDLYDRAHKLSILISSSLKSDTNDSIIQRLQEERRNIWLQIERMESSVQNNLPIPTYANSTEYVFPNQNSDSDNDNQSTAGLVPVRKHKYDQPAISEDDCIFELFPEEQKCKDPEFERLISQINRDVFHHDKFRGCQAAAIESVVNRNDAFVIMPTGAN